MTASIASTSRTGVRRLLGRRGAAVTALAAAAALSLSACGAGQISQTDTQTSAVTGSTVQSANGDITVNDIQLVLATKDAAAAGGPFHLVFTAANASAHTDYPLEQITIEGQQVDIEQAPATLCAGVSLTTPTPAELEKQAGGSVPGTTPATSPTPAVEPGSTTGCVPLGGTGQSGAQEIDDIAHLHTIDTTPLTLPGTHRPGTNVDAEFRFQGVEPLTVEVPITVPATWVGERSTEH